VKDASNDEAVIRGWWSAWPDANVGLATGNGLVVLDVDPRNGGLTSITATQQANGALPATVRVLTGGGGEHLYYRAPGQVRGGQGLLGSGIDIKGEGGYVIAPPSLHESGEIYRFDPVADLSTEMARLPTWLFTLLQQARRHRQNLAPVLEEGGRNAGLTSLAGWHRARGSTLEELEELLSIENQRLCSPPLPEDEVRAIAASVARYAPILDQIGRVHRAVDHDPRAWRGSSGASDWALMHAHIQIAQRCGKIPYDASVRELAERAGLEPGTVSLSHRRLVDAGWLQRSHRRLPRRPVDADVWTMRVPTQSRTSLEQTNQGVHMCVQAVSEDVWRWRVLGKSTLRVWVEIHRQGPETARQLAARFDMSERNMTRHLARLRDHGLAVRQEDGSWLWLAPDLRQLARDLGAEGKGARQRQKHELDRSNWERAWLASGIDPKTGEILSSGLSSADPA
jgi:DNA-binding MarR family transcriptional regulator